MRLLDIKMARILKFNKEKADENIQHIKAKLDAEEKILTNGLSEDEVLALSDILDKLIDNYTRQEEMAND